MCPASVTCNLVLANVTTTKAGSSPLASTSVVAANGAVGNVVEIGAALVVVLAFFALL